MNNNQGLKPLFVDATEARKKQANEKNYLVLFYATIDRGEEEKVFEILTGREAAYEYIKSMIECIDIHRSKVLVDTVCLKDAASVYEFMKYIRDNNFFDDSFDIEDYNIGDVEM